MINNLTLQNWKSHSNLSLDFKPGTNILLGPMGSGKSSVLQAISFSLFGTFAELKSRDVKIAELIMRDSKSTSSEISLTFNTKAGLLTSKRKIDQSKGTEAILRDSNDKLLAGTNPTAVNDYISQVLGIDEDVFLRNIYAMQNEIDLLLKMSPRERKQRIDELMGLDRFELARSNCVTIKNKISNEALTLRKVWEGSDLLVLNKQLTQLAEACKNLEAKASAKLIALKNIVEDKSSARKKLDALRKLAREAYELETRVNFLRKQAEDLAQKLAGKELKLSKEEIEDKLAILKLQIKDTQKQKLILGEEIEADSRARFLLEREVGSLEERDKELRTKLSELQKVREQLASLDVSELKNLEKDIQEKAETKQTLLAEIKSLRKSLEELELAESKCPVCDSQLPEEKKSSLISQKKREIAEKLFIQNETAERLNKLREKFSELDKLANLQKRFSEKLAEQDNLIASQRENMVKLVSSQGSKDRLEKSISKKSEALRQLESQIEKAGSEYNSLSESKHLYEFKAQKEQAEAEVKKLESELASKQVNLKDVEYAETAFQELLKQEQAVQSEINSSKELLAEKRIRLKELKDKLKQLKDIESRIKKSEKNAALLNSFEAALQATQMTLRDELILAVNEVMTSLWLELYPYNAWSGVRLSIAENDYTLQLKETDGDWVSVAGFASGGERMLASLAVRIAFARILSPNFSLLILDEPTHNLDEKAIESLIDIIQNKLSDHIEQIIIVTHDEKLAEAGDNVIRLV